MLNIKYDPTRDIEVGQYFVELAIFDPIDENHIDRLGYWCDLGHLHVAIIQPIFEIINEIIKA